MIKQGFDKFVTKRCIKIILSEWKVGCVRGVSNFNGHGEYDGLTWKVGGVRGVSNFNKQEGDAVATDGVLGSNWSFWYKLLNTINLSESFNDDRSQVTVYHPGLSYESFTRDGNPSPQSLLNVLFTARAFAYHKHIDDNKTTFLDYAKMTDKFFTFLVASRMQMETAMYDYKVSKSPLEVKINLGYIGKTSLNSVAEIISPGQGQSQDVSLMKNINQIVLVDKATRKPMPVPEWWREKYGAIAMYKEPLVIKPIARPETFFTSKVYVGWDDEDNYDHTNSASYFKFAINAIQYAAKSKFFRYLTRDHLQAGVKLLDMSAYGESAAGDLLEVLVWEVPSSPVVYCEFVHNGRSICQCKVEYHTP